MEVSRPSVQIDAQRCDHSPACPVARMCPHDAVVDAGNHYAIDDDQCGGCGICEQYCPLRAVKIG